MSLVAQLQVYDAIIFKRGVLNVEITNKMLSYGNQSRSIISAYNETLKKYLLMNQLMNREPKREKEQLKLKHFGSKAGELKNSKKRTVILTGK